MNGALKNQELSLTTILVVDDVQRNLDSMRTLLTHEGYEVSTCDSGEAALAWLLKNPLVSLILLDVQMPGMNGFELAEMIRLSDDFKDVPILFLSAAHSTDEYVMRGFGSGASDYLTKPVNNDILLQKIAIFSNLHQEKIQLTHSQKELQHLATHDPLTGLVNRSVLDELIKQGVHFSHREGRCFAVLFLDVDRFKVINDSLGHDAGDELLVQFAYFMQGRIRAADTLVRYGGDEFVLLIQLKHQHDIHQVLEKLMECNKKIFKIKEYELQISSSIGVCFSSEENDTANALLRNADTAMYVAKAEGGGTFHISSDNVNEKALRRMDIENGMRIAFREKQFELYYQPQLFFNGDKEISYEALLRWHRSDGTHDEWVSPGEFIPIAEETRLIIELGDWVLTEANKQAKIWQSEGVLTGRIAVNVSPVQLVSEGFIDKIRERVQQGEINPELLEIEITETALLKCKQDTYPILNAIKELGFSMALDDFGTGHSSLTRLAELPIDTLKIDQSFVRLALEMKKYQIIIESTVQMAQRLGMTTVAEGVETEQQFQLLKQVGCDIIQGYYYAKPMSVGDIDSWYHQYQVAV